MLYCWRIITGILKAGDFNEMKPIETVIVWAESDNENEIIHASLNKNIEALYDGLDEKIELGMQYARDLDGYVRVMKKDNSLRKHLKMDD